MIVNMIEKNSLISLFLQRGTSGYLVLLITWEEKETRAVKQVSRWTHNWQLGEEHTEHRNQIHGKKPRIVPRVVCRQKKPELVIGYVQGNWHTSEVLLCRCVLCAFINLLPEREVIVSATIILEWNTLGRMEKNISDLVSEDAQSYSQHSQ